MKRSVLALILVLSAFFGVYGQSTPMDVLLILDTSSSMSSSYENVNNYITGPFLSEYLRVGDTFHLIAYSGYPRLDIARRITGVGDVETIIGRMLIQYPVESGSNMGSAISFVEEYVASLPTRPKKVVLVGTGGGDANSLISAARQRLSSANVTFDFVQITPGQPLTNLPSSSRPGGSGAVSSVRPTTTPSTPAPAVPTPAPPTTAVTPSTPAPSTTAVTPSTPAPSTTQQPGAGTQPTGTATQTDTGTAAQPGATATTPAPGTTGTSGTETGAVSRPAEETSPSVSGTSEPGTSASGTVDNRQATESGTRGTGETGTPSRTSSDRETNAAWASSMPFIIGLIILALIVLGIIIFFATRKLGSSPNRVMAQVASTKPKPEPKEDLTPFVDHSKDLAKYAAVQPRQRSTPYDDRPVKTESAKPAVINPSGPLLLNLFVEDQNTAIGKRNIHSLKTGYSLSVGGGQSDFLIFLVPIPANIGEIRRNGSQCSFIPKKPKYFPDLGSNELRDCINKTIRVVSDKNYELRFRFEMYEDPLVALNRVLMSVNVPG